MGTGILPAVDLVHEDDAIDLPTGAVVTVGTFDGIHVGHRTVLAEVAERAHELGARSVAVMFDRHPAVVVRPESAPRLLTDLDQKLELLAGTGIDYCFVVHFDKARSEESPEEFVTEVLVGSMGAQAVVVGHDFHFGHRRGGNVALLQRMGAQYGFDVHGLRLIPDEQGGAAVSSTRIRERLAEGNVAGAAALLGRWHEVRGVVQRGDARGRTLGFPTANVAVPDEICLPADGIYAGWYERPDGNGPSGRDLARPAPHVLRGGRCLAARGPPARLRRRPLRGARPGSASSPGCAARSASPRSTTWSSRWAATWRGAVRDVRRRIG